MNKIKESSKNLTRMEEYKLANAATTSISDAGVNQLKVSAYAIVEAVNKDGEVYHKAVFEEFGTGELYSTGSNAVIETLDEMSDVVADMGMEWEDGIALSFKTKKSSNDATRSYLTVSFA